MPESSILQNLLSRWQKEGRPAPEIICRDCPELLSAFKKAVADRHAIENRLESEISTVEHKQKFQQPSNADECSPSTPEFDQTPKKRSGPSNSSQSPTANESKSTLGRYQLIRCIGRGGFGEVWKAFHPDLKKYVAIKRPRTDRAIPKHLEQFRSEAQKAAKLRHPAIVPVLDVERDGDSWFIVSELIEGVTLKQYAAKHRPSVEQIVQLVAEIADALHAAHRQRLIHRDVKPGNILIDEQGRPFLTDFGLALTEDEQIQEKDSVAGTYAYMSPEQIQGKTHFLDGRSDIYSLGAILYELLTGRRLFTGNSYNEIREQVVGREPKPPRAINESVPPDLERICLKCIHKSVAQRYATAGDLARDLRESLRPPKSKRPLLWVAGVLVCVGIAFGSAFFFSDKPGRNGATPDERDDKPAIDGWISLWAEPDALFVPPSGLVETKKQSVWIVLHDGNSFVRLGEVDSPSYEFKVTVEPHDSTATISIVLGLRHTNERKSIVRYQTIQLSPVPGRNGKPNLKVSRWVIPSYRYAGGDYPTSRLFAHTHLDQDPKSGGNLRFSVKQYQIESIHWNETVLPQLTNELAAKTTIPEDHVGGIGFFVSGRTVRFYRPMIKIHN